MAQHEKSSIGGFQDQSGLQKNVFQRAIGLKKKKIIIMIATTNLNTDDLLQEGLEKWTGLKVG